MVLSCEWVTGTIQYAHHFLRLIENEFSCCFFSLVFSKRAAIYRFGWSMWFSPSFHCMCVLCLLSQINTLNPWIFPAKHCMGSSTDSYWFRAVKLYAITSLIVVVLGVLLNIWRNHWQTKMYNFHNVKPMTQILFNNKMLNIIEIHAFTAAVISSWNFYLFFVPIFWRRSFYARQE